MTTLLPVNLSPFGHHLYISKTLQTRPRSLTSSSFTSISLPILCFDHIESFPLKPSGSLPDLSTMVSASTEKRHRTSSLNNTFHLSSASSSSTPSATYTNQSAIHQNSSSNEFPVSAIPNSTMIISQSFSSAFLSNHNFGDSNFNILCNGSNQSGSNDFIAQRELPERESVTTSGESSPREPVSPAMGRRRKNSSMTPVVPDLELMAKLRQEDEQLETQLTNDHQSETDKAVHGHMWHNDTCGSKTSEDDPKQNGHSSHVKEWQQYCGSEKESAAAWLAAATKRSPQARRKNGMLNFGLPAGSVSGSNSNLKSCCAEISKPSYPVVTITSVPSANNTSVSSQILGRPVLTNNGSAEYKSPVVSNNTSLTVNSPSVTPNTEKPKLLQPFGKNDRVRRTSILRPPSTFVASTVASCPKKKVSFADTMGKQLENVRYFVITPTVTRRYSSYTAPTAAYLTNGNYNSPWNLAINSNANRKPLGTNTSLNNVPQPVAGPIKDYDFSHAKLAPRYELVASNFTSPSLQLNFNQHLETQSVLLHSVTTAETTVYGTVSVMNRHFTKRVIVRYTFNEWISFIEREATYMLGSHDGRSDKFSFVIYARPDDFANNLATTFSAHQSSTYLASGRNTIQSIHPRLYFALRFITGDGSEFWDNNDGRNYCLNLTAY